MECLAHCHLYKETLYIARLEHFCTSWKVLRNQGILNNNNNNDDDNNENDDKQK